MKIAGGCEYHVEAEVTQTGGRKHVDNSINSKTQIAMEFAFHLKKEGMQMCGRKQIVN